MSESTPKLVKTSNQDAAMDPDVEPILKLHGFTQDFSCRTCFVAAVVCSTLRPVGNLEVSW